MARTIVNTALTEEQLEEAYRNGRRGKPSTYPENSPLQKEWERGFDKYCIAKNEVEPESETSAEKPPRKSRRTVQPGEPPKRYSQHEWPRGGHIRINDEEEEEYCWARKIRFQHDGALWVSGASCANCIDKAGCRAWKIYRKHLREEYGV